MSTPTPPRLFRWLLLLCTRLYRHTEIVDGLDDLFDHRSASRGERHARLRYAWDVLSVCLRPALRQPTSTTFQHARVPVMLKNHAVVALRQAHRRPGYTFINTVGLAVGLCVCLAIGLFVHHELSYDRFHEKADRTHRVLFGSTFAGNLDYMPSTPEGVGPKLAEVYPEIEHAVRLNDYPYERLVEAGDRQHYEARFLQTEPSFFDVFDFPLVAGDRDDVLTRPDDVLITPATAAKYFGNASPLGETMVIRGEAHTVRGIVQTPPSTSHLQFDFVIPRRSSVTITVEDGSAFKQDAWSSRTGATYVVLHERADPALLAAKFPDFVDRYAVRNEGEVSEYALRLQPLTAIHLAPDPGQSVVQTGPRQLLYLYTVVAALILLIGCVNYMNLATARSSQRAKEIGVRKTLGAHRGQIARQMFGETLFMTVLAAALALLGAYLVLPSFSSLIGVPLHLGNVPAAGWGLFATVVLVTGLLSGSYPALLLSRFRPVLVLKGGFWGKSSGASLRKVLVIGQLAASAGLMLATVVVHQQMTFVRETRLNAHDDQVLVVHNPNRLETGAVPGFKARLLASSAVEGAAIGSVPGGINAHSTFTDSTDGRLRMGHLFGDLDYPAVLGLEFVSGGAFTERHRTMAAGSWQERPVLYNETAMRLMGTTRLGPDVPDERIAGVIKDVHLTPLHETIYPVQIQLAEQPRGGALLVRLAEGRLAEGLAHVQTTWDAADTGAPLQYAFLDDQLDEAYRAELKLGQIFGVFAAIAVLLASLGLFGLASYAAERRRKEIGVRKVLGASVGSVVYLLSSELLVLVGVALALSLPLAFIGMQRWLDGFAYQAPFGVAVFASTALLTVGIALTAVGVQALKAATANPTDALRYE